MALHGTRVRDLPEVRGVVLASCACSVGNCERSLGRKLEVGDALSHVATAVDVVDAVAEVIAASEDSRARW